MSERARDKKGRGLWFLMCPLLASCGIEIEPADLVLTNGKIVTMEETHGTVEALAARAGTVVDVGTVEEIERYVGSATEVLDLEGALAIPGFIEGHGHFLSLGRSESELDLRAARTWGEIVDMVGDAADETPPGEWIVGRGWHQSKWIEEPAPNVEGLPLHDELSRVSPDNPVWLVHASGHAGFANAKGMELAGVDRETPDPEGGEIVRDSSGDPIGMFRETAQGLVTEARDTGWNEERARRWVELATRESLSKGITSFQDAGSSFRAIDLFRDMARAGELRLRLWVMIREGNEALEKELERYRLIDVGNGHLTVRAIKRSLDGALGTHGAWLFEPYADLPTSRGLNTTPLAELERTAQLALEHEFQVCVHAIGDRANHETLNLFEEALEGVEEPESRRWRIEHAQHLHPEDVPRFSELGVIASMQGIHCTSDAPWVVSRLGQERAQQGAYVWRDLLDSGAVVINGTDAPVEDVDPIASFYASVTRRLADGSLFFPEQRMTRMEALASYTLDAAWAAFEEDLKGSLAPGKLADITVLSQDILTVPDSAIPETRVLHTVVGGKVEYSAPPGS